MPALPCRLRHAATVLALAIPCHGALAGTSEWHFVYTGFEVTSEDQLGIETTAYDPAAHIDGRFSGTDVNANGVLEKEELSTLIVQGNYYQPCGGPYQTCTINAFSFGPGGVLSFKLEHHSSDPEGYFFFNVWVESGKQFHEYDSNIFDPSNHTTYTWTAQTSLSLTPPVTAPVPEPASWLMLGAGGLLLASRLRQRR